MTESSASEGAIIAGEKLVDINLALHRELTQVPGIGKVMASRIISGRPYSSLEELTRIQGIGKNLLESIRSHLTLSSIPSPDAEELPLAGSLPGVEADLMAQQPESVPEAESPLQPVLSELDMETHTRAEAEEPVIILPAPGVLEASRSQTPPVEVVQAYEKAEEAAPPRQMVLRQSQPSQQAAPPPAAPAPARPTFSRNETLAMVIGAAVLAVLVGAGLTLGILALVNRGLSYASATQAEALTTRVGNLEDKMTGLGQDIAGLRTRLDTLESVSGRVSRLEKEVGTVQQTLDEQARQFKQAQEELNQVKDQTSELQKRSQVFDGFLEGLRSLMNNVLPPTPR